MQGARDVDRDGRTMTAALVRTGAPVIVIVDATGPKKDTMSQVLDAAGRRRSPATMPGFHTGRAPRSKGMRDPADPPTIGEIVSVMRTAGDSTHGQWLRGLIV